MAQDPENDVEIRFLIRVHNLFSLFIALVIICPITCFFLSDLSYQVIRRYFKYTQCLIDDKPQCVDTLGTVWDILDSLMNCFRKDTIVDMSAARKEGRFHECLLHTLLPFYTFIIIFLAYIAVYLIFRLLGRYDKIFEVLDYPLHFAVQNNYYSHLRFFLSVGGWDVNGSEPKYDIRSPLNYVDCKDVRMVRLLLRMGADIRKTDFKLMYRAVKAGNKKTLRWLIHAGIDYIHSYNTMQVAVMLGKADVLEYLAQRPGANIDTPLGHYSPIHLAVRRQSKDMVQILLNAGADVMSPGNNGNTPAHVAAEYRNRGLTSILINRMENLEQVNWDGYTVLHMAVKARNEVVTKLLLDSGANIRVKHHSRMSVLHMACGDPQEDESMMIQLLLDKGAGINDMSPNRVTAFYLAAQYQKLPTIRMLLERGADPNIVTVRKETILHFAAANKEDQEVLKLFISMGFDCGVQTMYADTLITYAAQHGAFSNYLFLLRKYIWIIENRGKYCYEVYKTLLATAAQSIQYGGMYNSSHYDNKMELLDQIEKQLAREATSDVARVARAALKYMALAEHIDEDHLSDFLCVVRNQKLMSNYYSRCKNEILELERLQLLDLVITLLTDNDEELMNYATSVDMRLKVWEHRDKFPLYHRLIKEVFYPVVRVQAQRRQAETIVCHILGLPNATHLVAEKILSYLQPSDLSKLDSTV